MTGFWEGAEVISVYSRAQAIEDGTLVEVTFDDEPDFARGAGFLCPVAMTRTLFHLVEPNDAERDEYAQSLKGRMWDVLNMARFYRPRPMPADGASWLYPCIFVVRDREGRRNGSPTVQLKAVMAGGDNGEPVVTIMFANED